MRLRIGIIAFLVLAVAGFAALSLLRGQERPAPPAPPAPEIPTSTVGGSNVIIRGVPSAEALRNASKHTPLQQEFLLSAQRGAEWLFRMNNVKGHFKHGLEPALPDATLDGDSYLRQAGAAFALARAARFLHEDRYTARSTQAILALLDETVLDPPTLPSPTGGEGNKEIPFPPVGEGKVGGQVRRTAAPPSVVNPLGAAGLLVLAVNELPDPQADLLEQSEQLCAFLRKQARPDGSLACGDADGKPADEAEAVNAYPGMALYALMCSQKRRPAAWKTDLVRKAVAYYRPWWKVHKSMEFVPWCTAACSEAYLTTKEQPFAEFVFEMNDWLCGLQYNQLDPQRQLWFGGFPPTLPSPPGGEGRVGGAWADGKPAETAPTVLSAFYAEGLADACRTARQAVDLDRYRRYGGALQLDLQFVARLQYTEAGTGHFADWYRPRLVGGFYASHQDGSLRIDYTQHAVSALVQFLDADLR